jgi:hypothetical protein
MVAAKYNEFFGGWLAFRYGKAVKSIRGTPQVFCTEAAALKAAKASRMGCTLCK